jgi:hypothetical protein
MTYAVRAFPTLLPRTSSRNPDGRNPIPTAAPRRSAQDDRAEISAKNRVVSAD